MSYIIFPSLHFRPKVKLKQGVFVDSPSGKIDSRRSDDEQVCIPKYLLEVGLVHQYKEFVRANIHRWIELQAWEKHKIRDRQGVGKDIPSGSGRGLAPITADNC